MKDLIVKYRKYLFIAAPVFALLVVVGGTYLIFSSKSPEGEEAAVKTQTAQTEIADAGKQHAKQGNEGEEEKTGGVGEANLTEHEKKAEKEKEKANITARKSIQTSAGIRQGSDDDWKLDKPLDKIKFDDPKERELAQRSVIVNLKRKKKEDIATVKEWDPAVQAKKERAQAIEAWLEKGRM